VAGDLVPVARVVDLQRVLRAQKKPRVSDICLSKKGKAAEGSAAGWRARGEDEPNTLASLWQWRQAKTWPQQGATTLHPRL